MRIISWKCYANRNYLPCWMIISFARWLMGAIVLIPCQAVLKLPLLFCISVLVLHQQSAVQLQVHWLVDICKHLCKTAAGIHKASSEGRMRLATVLRLGSIFSPEPRQYYSTSGWCRNILYVPLVLVIICDWSSLNGIPNPLVPGQVTEPCFSKSKQTCFLHFAFEFVPHFQLI